MNSIITTNNLTKTYGKTVGLLDLNLDVESGEVFGFLGSNGAGKSTTMRLLTGFSKPTRGHAEIFGKNTWKNSVDIKKDMGFLPDFPALYEGFTGTELITYMANLQGKKASLQNQLIDQLELAKVDLDRKIKSYSRGMKQKIGIIQALQHDPSVVILDEPTEGLDPLMQQRFFDIITDCKSRGNTIFFSSHIISEVEKICDRIGILRKGHLIAVENITTLKEKTIRYMDITFTKNTEIPVLDLPCITSNQRKGDGIRIGIKGDINPLIKKLARSSVKDIVYEEAHLEDIFMDYYQDPTEEKS